MHNPPEELVCEKCFQLLITQRKHSLYPKAYCLKDLQPWWVKEKKTNNLKSDNINSNVLLIFIHNSLRGKWFISQIFPFLILWIIHLICWSNDCMSSLMLAHQFLLISAKLLKKEILHRPLSGFISTHFWFFFSFYTEDKELNCLNQSGWFKTCLIKMFNGIWNKWYKNIQWLLIFCIIRTVLCIKKKLSIESWTIQMRWNNLMLKCKSKTL